MLDVVTVWLMIAAVVLFVLSIRQKQPYELMLYSAFSLIQVLGSDGVMNSKGRLLIPAFTLLLPIAVFLNRERRSNAVLGIVLVGLMSCWYSAYAVVDLRLRDLTGGVGAAAAQCCSGFGKPAAAHS